MDNAFEEQLAYNRTSGSPLPNNLHGKTEDSSAGFQQPAGAHRRRACQVELPCGLAYLHICREGRSPFPCPGSGHSLQRPPVLDCQNHHPIPRPVHIHHELNDSSLITAPVPILLALGLERCRSQCLEEVGLEHALYNYRKYYRK